MSAESDQPLVERVQRLWDGWQSGGIDAFLKVAEPDVEWAPYGADGRVIRGHDEMRAYVEEAQAKGEVMEADAYSFEAHGDCVLVTGHVRYRRASGMTDTQVVWLYRFRDGRLVRAESFTSRDQALAASGAC